jgi:uncharacterized membrane protein YfcA
VEQLLFELAVIIPISIGIGFVASMVGISGGAFKTPILIIMFTLSAELAAAASLLSAFFVSIISTIGYYRMTPRPINFGVGMHHVILTIPGTYAGVVLRTFVAHIHMLQIVFAIILFPFAVKLMMVTQQKEEVLVSEKETLRFSQLSRKKLVVANFAVFLAGISAGLLGLGGGTIIVPVLCIILGFPIIMAAATSMFTMIFTSSVGSLMNYAVLLQAENMTTFLFYGFTMGIGMILGGLMGPKYAYKIDSVLLQRLFGFLLIFPLVKMMTLGNLWLDPNGSNYILATIGDAIIWLLIATPIWIFSSSRMISIYDEYEPEDVDSSAPLLR